VALSTEQLAAARAWVGTDVSDATLSARYDRLGSVDAAVLEELRTQLTTLLEQPSSVSLPSGLSVQITQNITALQQLIKEFGSSGGIDAALEGTSPTPGVSKFYRSDRR